MKKIITLIIGAMAFMLFPLLVSAQIRVVCVGDSTTYGYGLPDQSTQSFPARLQRLGSGYSVLNCGASGTCMVRNDPASYWNTGSFTQAQNDNPQILLILLGTNGGDPPRWNAHGGDFYNDYVAMINVFRANGKNPKIFVCYPLPCFTSVKAPQDTIIKTQVIPLIRQVAATQGLSIIDFNTTMQAYVNDFQADGIHPNPAGAQRMADIAFGAIGGMGGVHYIVNQANGLAIDNASSSAQGAGMLQWGLNGGLQQQWTLTQNPDTSWNIISQYSGQALDDPGSSTANGTTMIQWGSNGGANQRWWVDKQSDGSYKIWNVSSSLALDDDNMSTNGTPLIQWTWNGGNNQRWHLQ